MGVQEANVYSKRPMLKTITSLLHRHVEVKI